MCIVCQGQIPHPPLYDVPSYILFFQVMTVFALGYWTIFQTKLHKIFKRKPSQKLPSENDNVKEKK